MEVVFDTSFEKSLKKLKNAKVKERIIEVIAQFESAVTIWEVPNLKKMEGYENYYRVRICDFRVGVELQTDQSVLFILVANRKDIYKYFP